MKFNLPKRFWIGAIMALSLITVIALAGCNAAPVNSATPTPDFSTPPPSGLSPDEMIEWDYEHGNITEEQRLIYIVYMSYDYENLPARYFDDTADIGEDMSYYLEIHEIVTSKEKFCKLSQSTRDEISKIIVVVPCGK